MPFGNCFFVNIEIGDLYLSAFSARRFDLVKQMTKSVLPYQRLHQSPHKDHWPVYGTN